jgi:hypothetical protein
MKKGLVNLSLGLLSQCPFNLPKEYHLTDDMGLENSSQHYQSPIPELHAII